MEIRYVDWAIANNFGDYIEMNRHLKEWPELHDSILLHEMKHTNKVFSKQDFLLDTTDISISKIKLIKFMLRHPNTFLQFIPIYRNKGVWIYDLNLSIIWAFIILAIFLGYIFALK